MDYLYDLSKTARLDSIKEDKDIKQLSYAQFPGTHCPLFGSVMTSTYVKDLVILVAGTEECTYYAKDFAHNRQKGQDNVISFVANKNDIVFGCNKKIQEAILKIDKEIKPKGILIVTTCVLELIGEDFEAIVEEIKPKVNSKLMVVKTEHFKCNSHIPGIERTLEAFTQLMKPSESIDKTINILGYRYSGIENTELYKLLKKNNVNINLSIPSNCTIDGLEKATRAKLNIVTDFTALKLAQKMKEDFNIEYVYFDKHFDLNTIEESYNKIEKVLEIDLSEDIKMLKEKLKETIDRSKEKLKGKTFIYGNTPMNAFEFSSFLCDLGMEPLIIQVRELYENDNIYIEKIKEKYNPYISRIANVAPLRQFYDKLKVDYYIGHENPMELIKRGINQIVMDEVGEKLGFEVPITVIDVLLSGRNMFSLMGNMDNIPLHAKKMLQKIKDENNKNSDNKNEEKSMPEGMEEIMKMDFLSDEMKEIISKMDSIPPQMLKAMKMMKVVPKGMATYMMKKHMKEVEK